MIQELKNRIGRDREKRTLNRASETQRRRAYHRALRHQQVEVAKGDREHSLERLSL